MTNREVADAIGVTESYVSLIRAGKRLPGAAAIVDIVTAFKIDANEFVRAYREGAPVLAQYLEDHLPRVE
jgi:transcriptional regulator with XRE-family HTH domain